MQNSTIRTLVGEDINISVTDGTAYANSASIISTDVLLNNGVMHVVASIRTPHHSQLRGGLVDISPPISVLNPDNTMLVDS